MQLRALTGSLTLLGVLALSGPLSFLNTVHSLHPPKRRWWQQQRVGRCRPLLRGWESASGAISTGQGCGGGKWRVCQGSVALLGVKASRLWCLWAGKAGGEVPNRRTQRSGGQAASAERGSQAEGRMRTPGVGGGGMVPSGAQGGAGVGNTHSVARPLGPEGSCPLCPFFHLPTLPRKQGKENMTYFWKLCGN